MTPQLERLLVEAKEKYDRMTPQEKAAMSEAQRQSFVRGEMGWPKPQFHYENGVKVYHSYEDYCNG